MRALILFLITFSSAFAAGWKADISYKPIYYSHAQKGDLGNVTGTAIVTNSFEAAIHRKFKLWQFELGTQMASFPFKVEGTTSSGKLTSYLARIYYKEFFVGFVRSSSPYIEDDIDIIVRQLTINWAGVGGSSQVWNPNWKFLYSVSMPLASTIDHYDIKNDTGFQVMAGIRYWRRLQWQRKTWNMNVSLFNTYTNLKLGLDRNGGNNELQSHQLGLGFGLSKQF